MSGVVLSGRSGRVLRALGWALFALYCAAVAAIVFAPQHVDDNEAGSRLASLLDTGHAQGWLPGFITYASIEQLSNVIMFAPGGFFAHAVAVLSHPPVAQGRGNYPGCGGGQCRNRTHSNGDARTHRRPHRRAHERDGCVCRFSDRLGCAWSLDALG